MIVAFIFFLILLFIVLSHHFHIVLAILFYVILLIILKSHFKERVSFYLNNTAIPRYTKDQLYHELRHGDIINNSDFDSCKYKKIFSIWYYINYGIAHMMIILEENNEKYVLECIPESLLMNDKNIVYSENSIECNWYIVKTPLMEYLSTCETQVMRVFRNSVKLDISIPKRSFVDLKIVKITYCTLLIGDILVNNNIIPRSIKLFRHKTDDIISQLQKNGYESFLLIYSDK